MKNYDKLAEIMSANKVGSSSILALLRDKYIKYFLNVSPTLLGVYLFDNLRRLEGFPCSNEGKEDRHLFNLAGILSIRENMPRADVVGGLLNFVKEVKKQNLTEELVVFSSLL